MTQSSEEKNDCAEGAPNRRFDQIIPDFIADKEFVGTIVESLIIFFAVLIAVARSRKKIADYVNEYSSFLQAINFKVERLSDSNSRWEVIRQ